MINSALLVSLGLAAVVTSIISGIIGMAGGVTLLAILTFFLPWSVIVPIHGAVQLVSNSSRALFLRKHICWPLIGPLMFGVPFGAALSTFLIRDVIDKSVPQVLIALLILYVLFKPKKLPTVKLNGPGFFAVGVISGGLGMLVGATGPFLASFFLRDDLSKEQIVSSKAAAQSFVHFVKLPAFVYLSFDYWGHMDLILILSLGAIIGTRIGVKILGKVNDQVFIWLYQVALFAAAVRMVYKALE